MKPIFNPKKDLLIVGLFLIIGASFAFIYAQYLRPPKYTPPAISQPIVESDNTNNYFPDWKEFGWTETEDKLVSVSDSQLICTLSDPSYPNETISSENLKNLIDESGFYIVKEYDPVQPTGYGYSGMVFTQELYVRVKSPINDENDFLTRLNKLESPTPCRESHLTRRKTLETAYIIFDKDPKLDPLLIYVGNNGTYSYTEGGLSKLIFDKTYSTVVIGNHLFFGNGDKFGFIKPDGSSALFTGPVNYNILGSTLIDKDRFLYGSTTREFSNDAITTFFEGSLSTGQVKEVFKDSYDLYAGDERNLNGWVAIHALSEKDCGNYILYYLNPSNLSQRLQNSDDTYSIWGPDKRVVSPDLKSVAYVNQHPQGVPFGDECSGGTSDGILRISNGNTQKEVENNPSYGIVPLGWSSDSKYFLYSIGIVKPNEKDQITDWKLKEYAAYSVDTGQSYYGLSIDELVKKLNSLEGRDRFGFFEISQELTDSSQIKSYNDSPIYKDLFILPNGDHYMPEERNAYGVTNVLTSFDLIQQEDDLPLTN